MRILYLLITYVCKNESFHWLNCFLQPLNLIALMQKTVHLLTHINHLIGTCIQWTPEDRLRVTLCRPGCKNTSSVGVFCMQVLSEPLNEYLLGHEALKYKTSPSLPLCACSLSVSIKTHSTLPSHPSPPHTHILSHAGRPGHRAHQKLDN